MHCNDREEIRRRLALEFDDDIFIPRKPSFHSRIQNGTNLQICFMNETASDGESESSCNSDNETASKTNKNKAEFVSKLPAQAVSSKSGSSTISSGKTVPATNGNINKTASINGSANKIAGQLVAKQAQLQADAQYALAQAKEMARMQMELEKQKAKSPISDVIWESLNKVGLPLPSGKRRISRQILTDMNLAQLQVIVNEFHSQVECLNEALVKLLVDRDDLHMEQDSMLVDSEDLTKHLCCDKIIT